MIDICLKRSLDSANDKAKNNKLLTATLSSRIDPGKKEEILEHTYGIPMPHELKEAAGRMCNLSDLVEERGIERGIELNIIQLVLKKLKKSCTITQIADVLEEPEEKIRRIVTVAQKYAPEYDERKILEEVMNLAQS